MIFTCQYCKYEELWPHEISNHAWWKCEKCETIFRILPDGVPDLIEFYIIRDGIPRTAPFLNKECYFIQLFTRRPLTRLIYSPNNDNINNIKPQQILFETNKLLNITPKNVKNKLQLLLTFL